MRYPHTGVRSGGRNFLSENRHEARGELLGDSAYHLESVLDQDPKCGQDVPLASTP